MRINNHEMTVVLTVKELGTWMAALRSAARNSVTCFPWDANPFLEQHGGLVRLTGYCSGDHDDLREELRKKELGK